MSLRDKTDPLISEYCFHELKECKLRNKQGLFNQRCHLNSIDYASKHKGFEVVMGIQKYNEESSFHLHFWVRKNSIDYEVSVGYQSDICQYWEIKVIKPSDYSQIFGVFNDALAYYKLKFTTRWQRFWATSDERIL